MNLIMIGLFLGTIAPLRSRKHVPTPIWIREKHGRHLVKIEDKHQEEVFQVGESSQETMATPISDEVTQNIFKVIEEQSNALKKMGICLTKLEEAKLKKPPHVEVLDEEQGEDWDERDKANCERNKQFEKFMVETIAMREKMEKVPLAFRKA